MNSALVDQQTNIVVNIIVANPDVDPAPPGMLMIGLPENSDVSVGWIYDPITKQFTNPFPVGP